MNRLVASNFLRQGRKVANKGARIIKERLRVLHVLLPTRSKLLVAKTPEVRTAAGVGAGMRPAKAVTDSSAPKYSDSIISG